MTRIKREVSDGEESAEIYSSKKVKTPEEVDGISCPDAAELVDRCGITHNPSVNYDTLGVSHAEGAYSESEDDSEKRSGSSAIYNRKDAIKALFESHGTKPKDINKTQLENAWKEFAPRTLRFDEGNVYMHGMRHHVHLHQLFGGAWWISREQERKSPKGGILADDTGFGKTFQTIMAINNDLYIGRKGSQERKEAIRRITLIIAPNVAMADQWFDEILRHLSKNNPLRKKIVRYYAGMRAGVGSLRDYLKKNRIIITTYDEVMDQCPEEMRKPFENEEAAELWKKQNARRIGPFFKIPLHRVVLDEAHRISNHKTGASLACRALKAECYWALTATPMQNGIHELYPLFNFLKLPGTTSKRDFKKTYLKDFSDNGFEILKATIAKVLLRRTEENTIFGQKVWDAPEHHEETIFFDLGEEERKVYEFSEMKTLRKMSKIINESKSKTSEKNTKSKMLDLATQVRLLTAHVFLMAHTIPAEPDANNENGYSFSIENITKLLEEMLEGQSVDATTLRNMADHLQSLNARFKAQKVIYARRALPTFNKKQLKVIHGKTMRQASFKYKTSVWVQDRAFPLILSSKMKRVVNLILKLLKQAPDRKIVVFTQFIEVINILGWALRIVGVRFQTFHGKQSQKSRRRAKKSFIEDPEIKVFLSSLMAGGTGLNLQCASRIINIDYWWNSAKELQACGRIRRIGQEHNTEVYRLAARGTIDERLLKMQESKSEVINAILKGDLGLAAKDLSEQDMIELVGGHLAGQEILFHSPTAIGSSDGLKLRLKLPGGLCALKEGDNDEDIESETFDSSDEDESATEDDEDEDDEGSDDSDEDLSEISDDDCDEGSETRKDQADQKEDVNHFFHFVAYGGMISNAPLE